MCQFRERMTREEKDLEGHYITLCHSSISGTVCSTLRCDVPIFPSTWQRSDIECLV